MKQKELSSYKDNVIASKGKIVLSNIADYLVTMLMTLFAYLLIVSQIFSALPQIKTLKSSISSSQTSLKEIVSKTHLQTFKSGGEELYSVSEMTDSFLLTYAKTSFYLNEEEFPYSTKEGYVKKQVSKDETFLVKGYLKDPLGYYFYVYKEKEPELSSYVYDGKDYSTDKDDYFFLKASLFEKDVFVDYFENKTNDISFYRQLSLSKATLLADYLVYGEKGEAAKNVYRALFSSFQHAQSLFISEVETSLSSYVKENMNFLENYKKLNLGYILSYFVSFCIAFPIVEFLFPLAFKKHRTMGIYFFKLGYSTSDDLELSGKNIFLKGFFRFFLQLSAIFLVSFFFSSQTIFFVKYGSFFSFFYVLLFTLLLDLVSLVMSFVSKRHQGVAEICSDIVIKDPLEFEGRVSEKEENNGKNNQ